MVSLWGTEIQHKCWAQHTFLKNQGSSKGGGRGPGGREKEGKVGRGDSRYKIFQLVDFQMIELDRNSYLFIYLILLRPNYFNFPPCFVSKMESKFTSSPIFQAMKQKIRGAEFLPLVALQLQVVLLRSDWYFS